MTGVDGGHGGRDRIDSRLQKSGMTGVDVGHDRC